MAKKVAMNSHIFTDIMLASRNKAKCDAIASKITEAKIKTAQVDADKVKRSLLAFP